MIVDSSSLIIIAKVNKLEVLLRLYKDIFITKNIYKETVEEGMIIGASDSKIIKNFVEDNKIKILNLNKKYDNFSNELKKIFPQLGDGESDAISLALQEKDNIIMDEKIGRQVCRLYNLKPKGTLRILLEAYKNNIIKEDELKQIINDIIKYKFRIGADVINEFWNLFDKIKNIK